MCVNMLRCLPPTTLGDATALDAARRCREKLKEQIRENIFMREAPKGNGKRAIVVNGVRYGSIRRAAFAHSIAAGTMIKWLEEGKARYAED